MAATIRDATDDDLPAMVAIYNQLVRDTTVLWSDDEQDIDKRRETVAGLRERGFPVLVAEVDGVVAGTASYGDFRDSIDKPGYRYTAELSIHLAVGYRSQGIGPSLLDALLDHARTRGIHVMVAGVDGDNEGSVRFHERHGFVVTARMPDIGFKFGRRLELILMQRTLD